MNGCFGELIIFFFFSIALEIELNCRYLSNYLQIETILLVTRSEYLVFKVASVCSLHMSKFKTGLCILIKLATWIMYFSGEGICTKIP